MLKSLSRNVTALRLQVLGAAIAVSALASSVHAQGGMSVELARSRTRPGELGGMQLKAIVSRVASIALADTTTIHMHVGDTLSLASILLVARDSAGTEIGVFRTFDSMVKPGASLSGAGFRNYIAKSQGPTEFVLTFPKVIWAIRADEPASVDLRVIVDQ